MMPTIYLPVCDQNLWVIELYAKFAEKFIPDDRIVVMGFAEPNFELPENMKFVSMAPKQEGGVAKWSRYIHDYLVSVPDEYVVFSMEDSFPVYRPKYNIVEGMLDLMDEDEKIGRFDLTWDTFCNCSFKRYADFDVEDEGKIMVVEIGRDQLYRVSTQPSIWRKDFLVELLDEDWSPWDFEIKGSQKSYGMEERVLCIADPYYNQYPTKWTPKGAVSRFHEGMINILGLAPEDIREFVEKGVFTEDQLQWGQWDGPVPTFHELGGYNFHPKMMPHHPASPTHWKEWWPTYVDNKPVRQKL